ncbi:ultraviolet-B receptor UVR8-like isoform X2 [Populus nigra]|uniref:ultraviolet-B receptor UVR8-like isoform X2 n=1 Tax=Populus nigra TaxID=3691 RepID=UPI002B271231|nr:ultraviolet-B receptor UVR8-like isoform X2 [Populus nigra]
MEEKKLIVYMPHSTGWQRSVKHETPVILAGNGHLYTWGRGFAGASDANFPQLSLSSLGCTKAALGWNHCLLLSGDEEVCMLGVNYHGVLCDLEEMSAVKHLSDSSGALLNKVIGLDGVKVVKVAAGAEHSAIVTGKIIYHALIPIYICNKVTLLNQYS